MWKGILVVMVLLVGCKTRQQLGKNLYPNCKYGMYSKTQASAKLDSVAIDFNWMKIKTKVDIDYKDEKNHVTLQLRVKNDSLVYAKISKAGITGAKLLATRDTVIFIDKMNKQYYTGKYSDLEKLIGVSVPFEFLQNLFLGEPTFLYQGEGYKKIVEPLISYSNKVFEKEEQDSLLTQIQSFTCDSLKLQTVGVIDGKSQKEVWVNYTKPSIINGYPLNKKIELKGLQEDKPLILADIELKRIKTYDNLTAPIDIPDDFKKMEIK